MSNHNALIDRLIRIKDGLASRADREAINDACNALTGSIAGEKVKAGGSLDQESIWISIRDGEIVGTPFGPEILDGKYIRFAALASHDKRKEGRNG